MIKITKTFKYIFHLYFTFIDSPQAELPQVEIEGGDESLLMRSVSHYRKQKPVVKIIRNVEFVENEPSGKSISTIFIRFVKEW